jgi:WD40 repeat protein
MKTFPVWLRWVTFLSVLLLILVAAIFWITNSQGPVATIISVLFGALGLIFSFIQIFPVGKPEHSHAIPLPSLKEQSLTQHVPSSTSASPSETITQKRPQQEVAATPPAPIQNRETITIHREDWGEAPQVRQFYGRKREMALISQWLSVDGCHVITVLGMGGLGKTTLVTHLAQEVKDTFTYVFWRSLHNAPPIEDILGDALHFFSNQQHVALPQGVEGQIAMVIDYFRNARCLMVLDNFESVLQEGSSAGQYQAGYEGYGRLLQRIGEAEHQSCLLVTSREKPREVARLEGTSSPIRSLQITGVSADEGRELLEDSGVFGDNAAWATLAARYSGNPLALKLAAEPIREVFGGDITRFLHEGESVFGDIRALFDSQFRRLSPIERDLLYWFAIEREPVLFEDLQAELLHPAQKGVLLEALASLRRRSMIETSGKARFVLQAVLVEYITDEMVNQIYEEFQTERFTLMSSHALVKAQSDEDVRNSQLRLLLTPLLHRLLLHIGKEELEQKCRHILDLLRSTQAYANSYAAGNVLNLLILAQCHLRQCDFSHLAIRQAYLPNVSLVDVNFAYADLASSVFTDTFAGVLCVVFSPDGNRLAAGTASGEIRLWQADNGRPLVLCQGHTDAVWSVAFSPDGTQLVSGSQDQTVRLWDSNSGQCLRVLEEKRTRAWSVAFNADGTVFASGGSDHLLHLWDGKTGQVLRTLIGHTNRILAVAFSTDGALLASCSEDQMIRLWNVATGQCLHILKGHTALLRTVTFRSDGKMLASAGEDQTIRLWNVDTGECLKVLTGHTRWVHSVAFTTDGTVLASASEDYTVRLWDVATGQCISTLQRHMNRVWSVAFRPNTTILASGSDDQTIHVWDVRTGQDLYTLHGYTTWIWSVAFHPVGHMLASSDQDIDLWDIRTQHLLQTLQGHTNRVRTIAFSPDGNLLASGSDDQTVRIWKSGETLYSLQGHSSWVRSVTFHPDGIQLASGSDDQSIRLWNIATGQCVRVFEGHTRAVRAVDFSPDGSMLASSSVDRTIRLWETKSGECLHILEGHTQRIRTVAFSPDGQWLVSGSVDQTIRVWETKTGQCLHILRGHTQDIRAVTFSPNGQLLASSSDDQTIRIWKSATQEVVQVLHGHKNRVRTIAFSPDGLELASGSDDGTIKLWNVQDGLCLSTLRNDRPYERMNITGVTGISEAQKASLRGLGAVEDSVV